MKLFLSSLLLLSGMRAFAAKPVAMVERVSGHAFVLVSGVTKELKVADIIEDMNEVFVEDGGLITLRTSDEQFWHLPSLSHINFLNKIVELKKGQIWFQNKAGKFAHEIQTANAIVAYWGGEGIVSYDAINGKTQFLSIVGSMEFSNILDKEQTVVVDPGKFSFVDEQLDQGKPRQAVSIGKKSYDQFVSLFPGVIPLTPINAITSEGKTAAVTMVADEDDIINQAMSKNQKTTAVKREIASIPSVSRRQVAEEKRDIVIRRLPAQVEVRDFNLDKYLEQKVEKIKLDKKNRKFVPAYNKKSNVVMKIFGMGKANKNTNINKSQMASSAVPIEMKTLEVKRAPASTLTPEIKQTTQFDSELVNEYKKQMRHSTETNNLINELKSFQQDYEKTY